MGPTQARRLLCSKAHILCPPHLRSDDAVSMELRAGESGGGACERAIFCCCWYGASGGAWACACWRAAVDAAAAASWCCKAGEQAVRRGKGQGPHFPLSVRPNWKSALRCCPPLSPLSPPSGASPGRGPRGAARGATTRRPSCGGTRALAAGGALKARTGERDRLQACQTAACSPEGPAPSSQAALRGPRPPSCRPRRGWLTRLRGCAYALQPPQPPPTPAPARGSPTCRPSGAAVQAWGQACSQA